ncbi:MAG: hypothetical protein HXX16_03190 [Bacteroidales bacterium]|nr:hypothetical protein [Bacteroidales bacterium]
MSRLNILIDFIKQVLLTTFSQLLWLLGLLFIFGFILFFLARFTRNTYIKTTGKTLDIIVTGWIGTPIHELGHALFCIIFWHKIDDIKLYTPNSADGTLGYVNHSFNPKSIYQKIGNFFIGIGPIILGTIVLYGLLFFLVPNTKDVLSSIQLQSKVLSQGIHGEFMNSLNPLWKSTLYTLETLFKKGNFTDYKFWIFLYLSMCISSHMELSPPDIKGAWRGLLSIVIFFLVLNIIIIGLETVGVSNHFGGWWKFVKIESYASGINKWVGTFGALSIFASVLSGLIFFTNYFLLNIYSLSQRKGIVNPFWV